MVTEPTCIHGLVVRWCSLCRQPKLVAESEVCRLCDHRLEPGDVVTRIMPSGDVIHEYCQ